jgi:hypothetical protein
MGSGTCKLWDVRIPSTSRGWFLVVTTLESDRECGRRLEVPLDMWAKIGGGDGSTIKNYEETRCMMTYPPAWSTFFRTRGSTFPHLVLDF